MRLALYLLTYAAAVGLVAEALLIRWSYLSRSPRVALWLWHASAMGVLTSVFAALLVLAHDVWEHTLAWVLHADKRRLHDLYAGPGEVDQAWNSSVVLLAVILGIFVYLSFGSVRYVRRLARAQQCLATSRLLRSSDSAIPALGLIPHQTPAIYCVAGRKAAPRILVTTGAVETLTAQQLDAALEHERAHLRRHHHAMTLFADVVHRLTRWFGLFRHYPEAVRDLIEMAADDEAAHKYGRQTVAAALLEMSTTPGMVTEPVLRWTGADTAGRIRRLIRSPQPGTGRVPSVLLCFTAFAVAVLPVGTTIGPATALAGSAHDTVITTYEQQAGQPGRTKFKHHE